MLLPDLQPLYHVPELYTTCHYPICIPPDLGRSVLSDLHSLSLYIMHPLCHCSFAISLAIQSAPPVFLPNLYP